MKKNTNKGFIIVETLVVSAFVLGIFTFIYVNVIPLIGLYEKRNTYDDIESVYNINTIRKNLNLNNLTNITEIQKTTDFCGDDEFCKALLTSMEINYIGIINTNNTSGEKPDGLTKYLDYIGSFNEERIIIIKQHQDQCSYDEERVYPVRFANLKKVGGL
ncbi:MAG: hypothetical protein GX861_00825 [Tenericutes bacterium]|jgi:hypothetical protein|nr:hypothetical protein [Mycoplasmatota bacterium]